MESQSVMLRDHYWLCVLGSLLVVSGINQCQVGTGQIPEFLGSLFAPHVSSLLLKFWGVNLFFGTNISLAAVIQFKIINHNFLTFFFIFPSVLVSPFLSIHFLFISLINFTSFQVYCSYWNKMILFQLYCLNVSELAMLEHAHKCTLNQTFMAPLACNFF